MTEELLAVNVFSSAPPFSCSQVDLYHITDRDGYPAWERIETLKRFGDRVFSCPMTDAMCWAKQYAEEKSIWFLPEIGPGTPLADSLNRLYARGMKS